MDGPPQCKGWGQPIRQRRDRLTLGRFGGDSGVADSDAGAGAGGADAGDGSLDAALQKELEELRKELKGVSYQKSSQMGINFETKHRA